MYFFHILEIEVTPLLFKKGTAKLALYGMSSVKDERLHRLFREDCVKMLVPAEDTDGWFNLLVLHQNRAYRSRPTNYIPDHFLPEMMDLVLWGHEHDCRIEPERVIYGDNKDFFITQPGSSVGKNRNFPPFQNLFVRLSYMP